MRPQVYEGRDIRLCTADVIAITPPSEPPGYQRACRGGSEKLSRTRPARRLPADGRMESKMPKMKTKSGAKKRFKVTATGKVLYAQKASGTA